MTCISIDDPSLSLQELKVQFQQKDFHYWINMSYYSYSNNPETIAMYRKFPKIGGVTLHSSKIPWIEKNRGKIFSNMHGLSLLQEWKFITLSSRWYGLVCRTQRFKIQLLAKLRDYGLMGQSIWTSNISPTPPPSTLGTPQAFDCVPCPGSGDLSGTWFIFWSSGICACIFLSFDS